MTSRSRKRRSDVVDVDLEEFISEVKRKLETKRKEDAECALLFGCSLFPNNVELKKLAYNCAKENIRPYEAASFFYGLYPQCNKWEEVDKILKDVHSQRKTILSDIFYNLPFTIQYEMVNAYAQTLETPNGNRKGIEFLQRCKDSALLKLQTLKEQYSRQGGKYFTSSQQTQVMQQVDRVTHTFLTAEADYLTWLSSCTTSLSITVGSTPLNWYRLVILQELFPLLYEYVVEGCHIVDKTLVQRIFTSALQFLLCYATHIPRLSPNANSNMTASPLIVQVPPDNSSSNKENSPDKANVIFLDQVNDVSAVLMKPWSSVRLLLHQASVIFNWSLKEKDTCKLTPDSALDLLKQWNIQLQSSHSSRHQIASSTNNSFPKLARLEVGAVYWSFLSDAIMRYLRTCRPYLFRIDSSSSSKGEHGQLNIISGTSCPTDKDVFFLQRSATVLGGGKVESSRILECGSLFDNAIRLYESLSGSTAKKYTSKLEANLRVSAHWLFDRIFFVDYYTSRGSLQGANSALLVLDTLSPVFANDPSNSLDEKNNYSILHNAFLKAVLKLQLGQSEEAWPLLWLCYHSLISTSTPSMETSNAFYSRLEQSVLSLSEQGKGSSRDALPRGGCSHEDLLQTFCRFLFDDVHIFHFMAQFLLCHVVNPLLQYRRNDIHLSLASLILVQVLLPLRVNPDACTRSLSVNQTLIQSALDTLHETLVFAKQQSSSAIREKIIQWIPFVEDSELRGHLCLLTQNYLMEQGDANEEENPIKNFTLMDSSDLKTLKGANSKWSSVVQFLNTHEALFKSWIVDLASVK